MRGEFVGEHVLGSHGATIEDELAADELAPHAPDGGFAEGAGDDETFYGGVITAPDGTVIVEYKHSPHPNAETDSALFGHAREYVLALVAAVREREAKYDALLAAARECLDADDAVPYSANRRRRAEANVALAALVR